MSGHRLYVRYVLDLAEIPTFQARQDGVDAERLRASDSRAASTSRSTAGASRSCPSAHALAFPMGVGGLHTMRLEVIMRGPARRRRVEASPSTTRTTPTGSAGRRSSSARTATSRSDELRAYPKSLLQSPLDVTSAAATVAPTSDPVPGLTHGRALEAPDRVADSGFTRLITRSHLSVLVILASLAAALFWGAAHALSPGHGKTIVTAYLIGKRGTPKDAALLGGIVTLTHTIGVFALGLVTLALSQWIVPDQLYPWIDLVAGLHGRRHRAHGPAQPGGARCRAPSRSRAPPPHDHEHEHDISRRSLLAVGVSGGLLPCPSALVVLLAAISLHRLAFGLVLIVAFSLGLALSITGIGLGAVLAKKAFARRSFDGALIRALPAVSALVIVVAGVLMTVHAIPKVH